MNGAVYPVVAPRCVAHDRRLVILRFWVAIAAPTICLLCTFGVKGAGFAEPGFQNAQRIDRGGALPIVPTLPETLPETRGRPSPELPEIQPSPPSPSGLKAPAPAPPSEAAPSLRQGPRFVLRDVNIVGNTVLDQASIHGVVAPYLGKPVTTGDL